MQPQIKVSDELAKVTALQKKEEEKMHDVLLLLESLTYREEASIKLIIDCLYDIGSINLINQRFRSRTLNGSLKWIAKLSKPAFRVFAWRWYKNNCPQLIAKWLRKKVAFPTTTAVKQKAQLETQLPPEATSANTNPLILQSQNYEVKYLRSQVRMLASLVVGLSVILGGSVVWFGYSSQRHNLQTLEQLKNRVRTLEASTEEPFATGKGN